MTKRPTMIDIGLRAAVSQGTVSLVLNGVPNSRISAETRQRVLDAAEALGYRKGPRRDMSSKQRVIGLLIDDVVATPFAMQFLHGAREEAALHECVVASFCTRGDPATEAAALDMLEKTQLLGVLYTTILTRDASPPDRLQQSPTILLNCHERKRRFTSILPGDLSGGFAATETLLRAGHRRIAHLAGEAWGEATRDRAQGYRRALTTWDVAVDPDLILAGGWTIDGGRDLTLRLLDMPNPPTAIFCFNDRMALGAYDAIRMRGLKVPDDLSVVGFDDEDLVAHLAPPLTTVALPHEEMARAAINMLVEGKAEAGKARRIKIECSLVHRMSVGAPKVARNVVSSAASAAS